MTECDRNGVILKIPWGQSLRRGPDSGFRAPESLERRRPGTGPTGDLVIPGPFNQRGRRRRMAKDTTPTRIPQKAETMPKGWMPETVTTSVIRAASMTAGW